MAIETISPTLVGVCVPEPLTAAAARELLRHSDVLTVVPLGSPGETSVALLATDSGGADFRRSLWNVQRNGCTRILVVIDENLVDGLVADAGPAQIAVMPRGCLDREMLERTLTAVARGESVLPTGARWLQQAEREQLVQKMMDPRDLLTAGLSARELDLLRGLAEGLTLEEIAKRMRYSDRTLKNILHEVTSRLGLRNRTQAVAYAIRAGAI